MRDSLKAWFSIYHAEVMPDAKPNTVRGWEQAVSLARLALPHEPTIDDLTTGGLRLIETRLLERGKSRWTITRAMKSLVSLWRFVSDRGEAIETAPKRKLDCRRRIYLNGRTRMEFDSFEKQVGLSAVRRDDLPADEQPARLDLPTIDGPRRQDFDQYRNEVEAARKIGRADLRRLFGVMLFNWSALYLEWAGISGKARNQWRFALLRFADYLKRPPQLDDLTGENLTAVEIAFGNSDSATCVVKKLRCVWRFAWEVGVVDDGPPVNGNWRAQRWTMHRLGRPSVRVC